MRLAEASGILADLRVWDLTTGGALLCGHAFPHSRYRLNSHRLRRQAMHTARSSDASA
jgi:hypothetical protein